MRKPLLLFGLLLLLLSTAPGNADTVCFGTGCGSSTSTATGVTPGVTTVTGCTSKMLLADSASTINCSPAFVVDSSGSGASVMTFRRDSLAAVTDNAGFFNFQGTLTTPTSGGVINGFAFWVVGAGSGAVVTRNSDFRLQAGYTGAAATVVSSFLNQTAGTGADWFGGYTSTTAGGNWGVLSRSNVTTVGSNVGILTDARGGNINVGGVFESITNKANAVNVGVASFASQTTGTPVVVGGHFDLGASIPTFATSAAISGTNRAIAADLLFLYDNAAAVPTTGATASFRVVDGAHPQLGNGVLTNATMAAETQAQLRSATHSYTWTNAQVVALGAMSTGDIDVVTLPAKTVVTNAYVVILTPDTSANALTVACGRTGALFIDYIGANSAKAAANTVYGDDSAERGANLTGFDLPSYTGTTTISCHFIKTLTNLDTVVGSTGRVILETTLLP